MVIFYGCGTAKEQSLHGFYFTRVRTQAIYSYIQHFNDFFNILKFITRILKLNEVGLIGKWHHDFYPKDTKCSRTNRNSRGKEPLIRLSLGHLSGAFAILLIGYSMAFLVFIGEHTIAACKLRKHLLLIAYLKSHLMFILQLAIATYNRRKPRKLQQTKINKLIKAPQVVNI